MISIEKKLERLGFDLDKVKLLAVHGLTDVELAYMMGTTEMTINRWKAIPAFRDALDKAKLAADMEIEKSLYRRATGYEYEEVTTQGVADGDGQLISKKISKVSKSVAPDVVACIFWLKNRRPGQWRDRHDIDFGGSVDVVHEQRVDDIDAQIKQLLSKYQLAEVVKDDGTADN